MFPEQEFCFLKEPQLQRLHIFTSYILILDLFAHTEYSHPTLTSAWRNDCILWANITCPSSRASKSTTASLLLWNPSFESHTTGHQWTQCAAPATSQVPSQAVPLPSWECRFSVFRAYEPCKAHAGQWAEGRRVGLSMTRHMLLQRSCAGIPWEFGIACQITKIILLL